MEDPFRRPTFGSAVFYKDPFAALDWLEKAFGFARSMVITDKDGKLGHSEMKFGEGYIMVGSEWADFVASPSSVGGKNTQAIHVHLKEGIDAHCFLHDDGSPIIDLRHVWKTACLRARLQGRISHDFRRAAVRNLDRAGIEQVVAGQLTGHKTISVYQRYSITDDQRVEEAKRRSSLHV